MTSISGAAGEATESGGIFGKRGTACVLLIIGAVLVANVNALFADFVWDDRLLIVGNSSIKHLNRLPALFTKPFLQAYYRPTVMLSFALEHAVYGLRPWGFHLTNLLLHSANAVLVFALLTRISRSRDVALIAALLFAAHPANKAVITINDRTGLLAAFFFFSSLILYMKHRQTESGARSLLQYAASCALFGLGLFSKEEALTLPLALVLVDSLILNEERKPPLAARVARYLPFLFLIAFFFWIRGRIISADIGIMEAFMVEPARRLMTVPSILLDYLLTLLLPIRINYDPRIPLASSIFQPGILTPLLLLAALAAAIPMLVAKAKREAFGTLWYFITFIPMCNIVPIYPDVADVELTNPVRYLYLPSVGVFLFAALMLEKLINAPGGDRAGRGLKKAALAALCCLIFLFSLLSINRNILWKDEVLFYRYVIDLHPENHKMHFNLGTAYMQRGKPDAAVEEYRRAATLAPDRAEYRNNLALAYKAKGWFGRALEEFERALQLDPDSAIVHANIAAIYTTQNKIPEAIASGEKAVELTPSSLTAHVNLAEAYRIAGNPAQAKEHFQTAIRINPDSAKAHSGLGMVYASAEQYTLARKEWETALRIRPDFEEARENLRRLERIGH